MQQSKNFIGWCSHVMEHTDNEQVASVIQLSDEINEIHEQMNRIGKIAIAIHQRFERLTKTWSASDWAEYQLEEPEKGHGCVRAYCRIALLFSSLFPDRKREILIVMSPFTSNPATSDEEAEQQGQLLCNALREMFVGNGLTLEQFMVVYGAAGFGHAAHHYKEMFEKDAVRNLPNVPSMLEEKIAVDF